MVWSSRQKLENGRVLTGEKGGRGGNFQGPPLDRFERRPAEMVSECHAGTPGTVEGH